MAFPNKKAQPGCLGRLIKLTVVFAGIVLLGGLVDLYATGSALKGDWQYSHNAWSESTVETMVQGAKERLEEKTGRSLGQKTEMTAEERASSTKALNQIFSSITSGITLRMLDGGYRIEGATGGGKLVTGIFRALASREDQMGGCTTGSWSAAFPVIRATCGDGTGRTLYFLMRGWPSEELELTVLPLGSADLRDKVEAMSRQGATSADLKAAEEVLTFRFKRAVTPPAGQ